MKKFSLIDKKYRVRIDTFSGDCKSYVSNKTFDTYDSAWQYAVKESEKFQPCGYCVIYEELPKIELECNLSFLGEDNVII